MHGGPVALSRPATWGRPLAPRPNGLALELPSVPNRASFDSTSMTTGASRSVDRKQLRNKVNPESKRLRVVFCKSSPRNDPCGARPEQVESERDRQGFDLLCPHIGSSRRASLSEPLEDPSHPHVHATRVVPISWRVGVHPFAGPPPHTDF